MVLARQSRHACPSLHGAALDQSRLNALDRPPRLAARRPPATLAAAERLLALVAKHAAPARVQVEPEGTISFEWEAGEHGWLTLTVDDRAS